LIDIGEEEPVAVTKLKLYKFDRKGGTADNAASARHEWLDLVPFEDPATDNTNQDATAPEPEREPATLEEAKREVAEALKEIWQFPESERSSAIKRLIRRWHPDKNQHRESFANEVTKFLLSDVERLKKGGVPGYRPEADNSNQSSRGPSRPTWNGPDFQEFFNRYQGRARRQRQRHREWQDADYEDEPVNKDEAKRWMRQARKDFNTASHLFRNEEETYCSFTCFHCQQAVEKALKALMFAKGRLIMSDLETHDVLALAYRASEIDSLLLALPDMVRFIHGYYTKTRYPQYRRGYFDNTIPAELFSHGDAEKALSNARETLQLLRQVMD
jgi:HEPN domain-containing protein